LHCNILEIALLMAQKVKKAGFHLWNNAQQWGGIPQVNM